ncbi:MAG: hypothetical protein II998_04995 [Clostridia bacterium]|nr:hypothetical protein [Clostridia bacterium]
MNYSEINKLISNKIKKSELFEVFRNEIDEMSMLGNAIAMSSTLLCFGNFVDFRFDGVKIIRNKDISDIALCDKNPSLAFMNSVCKKENLFPEKQLSFDLKNWNSVFSKIQTDKIPVSVECAFEDAVDYYFGFVTEINSNLVTMQCFDGSGIMFKEKVKVNLNFVSAVTAGDKYTNLMAKYAK